LADKLLNHIILRFRGGLCDEDHIIRRKSPAKQHLPPAPAIGGECPFWFQFCRWHQAHNPSWQRRIIARAARRTEMAGVVYFHEAGLLQIVGIDDAAVTLVMVAAQQRVDFLDKIINLRGAGRGLRQRFADSIQVPAIAVVYFFPEICKLLP